MRRDFQAVERGAGWEFLAGMVAPAPPYTERGASQLEAVRQP
jgi:hypothetical protein